MSTQLTEAYIRRLTNYLLWATMENVGTSGSIAGLCDTSSIPKFCESHFDISRLPEGGDLDGLPAEEVMFRWESKGEKNLKCNNWRKLYRYAAGKNVRDFYVSNWVKDVEGGLFVAEEFICTGGMDIEEFHRVFKRYPDPWLLKRIWKLVQG